MLTSIPVHTTHQLEPAVDSLCSSWWTCQLAGFLATGWMILTMSAFTVVLFAAVAILQSARTVVSEEQSRTAAEEDAFLAFARRVDTIACPNEPNPHLTADGGATSLYQHQSTDPLDEIRVAYQDTVMSTPHYEEEYAESLVENLSIELGTDVAASVAKGTELSPLLKQLLVGKATQAATERERFTSLLELEAASLREAEKSLAPIEDRLDLFRAEAIGKEPYGRLLDHWDELASFEEECRTVLEERQELVRSDPFCGPDGDPGIQDYLYDTLPVDYPVLASGTSMIGRIDNARQNLVRVASNRV